tara:strand:+ start:5601 stop:6374 length:774 start_codon:yes stop_codon:yes gene_type:complete
MQFGEIFSCYDIGTSQNFEIPFLTWMINTNHGNNSPDIQGRDLNYFKDLNNLDKPKKMSVICSTKSFTESHKKRLDFVYKLKEYFQEDLDWFGNGINPIKTKWEGISPYKYHIVLENKTNKYIVSEKLYDSYLGLSFPFYSGATNVNDYFPEDSLLKIDINDYAKSIFSIEEAINKNVYEENYDSIIKSKNIVCEELNLFNRVAELSLSKSKYKDSETIKTFKSTIRNKEYFEKKYMKKDKLKRTFFKYLKKLFILK